MKTLFEHVGVLVPEIYLPKANADWTKRAVVACDQYTSEPEYWEAVAQETADAPSTFKIIFPEVYLEDGNSEQRIQAINQQMDAYLAEGTLENKGKGFIYVERQTSHAPMRKGLIIALDLEKYDFNKGSQTLIRATEGTILDRLPPRMKIRQGASLESPHIMVLIDDPEHSVIEPLRQKVQYQTPLYDFDLMKQGGHITGYHIHDEETIQGIITALEKLADPVNFNQKYQTGDNVGVLLFAMGDGNHSFATAKAIWEETKKQLTPAEQETHPARFALVELNNVHDEGIVFEPIHRVLFNVNTQDLFAEMQKHFQAQGSELIIEDYPDKETLKQHLQTSNEEIQYLWGVDATSYKLLGIKHPKLNLEVGNIQQFLDQYLAVHPESKIDYVHGEEVTERLGKEAKNLGLLFPIMDKSDFFKTVVLE